VIPNQNEREGTMQFEDIIQEELNVKEVQWTAKLPEGIELVLKPRFSILGPKHGSKVKEVARALSQVDRQTALQLLEEGHLLDTISSKEFIALFFEAVSAFGTVGLSRGITPELSTVSKVALIITMFGGRIGPLTLLVALAKQHKEDALQYPEEHLLIG